MNKAFTKETEFDAGPEREEDASVPGGKNYITPAGVKRLQDELRRLQTEERPQLLQDIERTRDTRGAADDAGLKRRLRELDRRIRFIAKRLEAAVVIDPTAIASEQVVFGATVTIRNEDDVEKTYAIVGIDEADAGRGRISWISPLARAMLKAREGDVVTFRSPRGEQQIEIVKVQFVELT